MRGVVREERGDSRVGDKGKHTSREAERSVGDELCKQQRLRGASAQIAAVQAPAGARAWLPRFPLPSPNVHAVHQEQQSASHTLTSNLCCCSSERLVGSLQPRCALGANCESDVILAAKCAQENLQNRTHRHLMTAGVLRVRGSAPAGEDTPWHVGTGADRRVSSLTSCGE